MTASGYESIPITAAPVGFTAAELVPGGGFAPTSALVSVEDAPINVTVDGTTVTGAVGGGHRYEIGASFLIIGISDLVNFSAIRAADAGVDGNISVTFFKE